MGGSIILGMGGAGGPCEGGGGPGGGSRGGGGAGAPDMMIQQSVNMTCYIPGMCTCLLTGTSGNCILYTYCCVESVVCVTTTHNNVITNTDVTQ